MKVIGCEVIDANKKFARVIIIFEDNGKIAQTTIPLSKLRFITINAQPTPGSQ